MFADFGAPLPALTVFVIRFGPMWALMGAVVPVACVISARRVKPATSVILSTVLGMLLFFLAQLLTLGLFLPVFQLGSVAAK
ncbi:hypothetical protein DB347_25405 [Opitutaceae bacterium EW11]|nr:hypothetical protein DB347_25405 [Opitutaceae bacterium EW11]